MKQISILLFFLPASSLAASGSGVTTRYWDCCKPSCAWPDKASVNSTVLTCAADDSIITDPNTKSGCDGGTAYTCADNSPWALNDLISFGYAATKINGGSEASWCCACYELTFTSGKAKGKQMVVQSTNTGSDLGSNHFDILMPGGGVGIFNGCSSQFGGIAGDQYGGISSESQCDSMPEMLQAGCRWRFEWFNNADNPTVNFRQVQCPDALVANTGCKRDDDSSFPVWTMPATSTWIPPASTETAAANTQCDGPTWDAAKFCPAGYYCKPIDKNWSQCVEGTSPISSSSTVKQSTATTSFETRPTSAPGASPTKSAGTGTTVASYAQCGSDSSPATSICPSDQQCASVNPYYYQCQPTAS
ncbi:hypothetical protein TD95_003702 [Thielaviopsis punctulata]|uniref:Cellulase n=1 Tax=Thielaviopsis punctulata TaxID=72032 RepID=A0A0F4ZDP5_9PEZI|nr:hypothetical protein TD95_003702 [Thielaviopsis punctulata]